LFIVGGALRNVIIRLFHGSAPVTKDIDIFIGNISGQFPLEILFKKHRYVRTDLVGICGYPEYSGFAFDLCLIPNSFPFRNMD
jgi:lipoprotein signal peptidase